MQKKLLANIFKNDILVYSFSLICIFGCCHFLEFFASIILIFIIGFPHAISDPFYIQKTFSLTKSIMIFYLLAYLFTALISFAFWLAFPQFSLAIFLLISSMHFGEDFFSSMGKKFFAGGAILCYPMYFHLESVQEIFQLLTFSSLELQSFYFFIQVVVVISLLIFLYEIMQNTIACQLKNDKRRQEQFIDPILGVFLFFLSIITNPLTYFAVYFCALHSQRHYREIQKSQIIKKDHLLIVMILIFFTYLLILGAFLFFYVRISMSPFFIGDFQSTFHEIIIYQLHASEALLRTVFTLLFSLTVPHMITIELVRAKKNN